MTEKSDRRKTKRREIEIVHPSYQPSKAELEADARVNVSFDEAVDAVLQPAKIRYIPKPKPKPKPKP